jgi:hypothetical protein
MIARFFVLALPLTLLLCSCATPYFGYSKAEWNALSPEEQRAAKADYQPIIDERLELYHEDQIDEFKGKIIEQGLGVTPQLRRY